MKTRYLYCLLGLFKPYSLHHYNKVKPVHTIKQSLNSDSKETHSHDLELANSDGQSGRETLTRLST